MRFAINLRQRRQMAGLSQEEMAARAGLHRTYIGSVERGERNISVDNMEQLAAALSLDILELLALT
jgi:transcriptional regulator with XRE-family HTH domain